MKKWLIRLSGTFAVLAAALGGVFAWGHAAPLSAVVETRAATLFAGVITVLLALPLARWWRVGLSTAGIAIIAMAISWYVRYAAIPVEFRGDVALSGTLYRPRGVERPAVVVFIHGSGRETRREFRHYAQLYALHGIASLAYDKRGSGASGGSTYEVGYDGYARDAAAAARFVAVRPDLDSERIAMQGQSEGAWVLPLALRSSPSVRGVIVTAPTLMTPAEQVVYETATTLRHAGFDDAIVRRAVQLQRRVMEYQRSGRAAADLEQELRAASHEPWFETAELPSRLWPAEEYRWWRSVMDFDPVPYWRTVSVPVLAISGANDTKTDGARTQQQLRFLLAEAGNRSFTGHVLPGTEHGMTEWCLGDRIPPPCWPDQMPGILTGWLEEQVTAPER